VFKAALGVIPSNFCSAD